VKRTQLRAARAGDHDAIRAFFAALSPDTRYLRFFTAAPQLSGAMLRALCGVGDDIDVVVAAEAGVIVGHAMAVDRTRPDGTRQADIGVVVAEDRQDRGIGTALVQTLATRALARGASIAAMDVLAGNRRVLALIRRRWPDATYQRDGISVTVNASLLGMRSRTQPHPYSRPHSHPQPYSQPQPGTRQKGRASDESRRAARHPQPRIRVGGPRDLRRCGA
jgi:GNAT superfamily N-acetyltransferase